MRGKKDGWCEQECDTCRDGEETLSGRENRRLTSVKERDDEDVGVVCFHGDGFSVAGCADDFYFFFLFFCMEPSVLPNYFLSPILCEASYVCH